MICALFLFCSLIVNNQAVTLYPGAVSRFDVPAIVLLAHNTRDGQYFDDLEVGDMVRYYEGEWQDYRVREVREIEAATLVPEQVYREIYNIPETLVLQTCIEKDGDLKWGRLFVIAEKAP